MKGDNRRIERKTSRTAEMTCLSGAASFYENIVQYKTNDFIAPKLVPIFLLPLLRISLIRNMFRGKVSPKGIYEYVIARTKYIDAIFQNCILKKFNQVLIFGAGFDSRGLRFLDENSTTKIFELDVPITQKAKINQLKKRRIPIHDHIIFIPIDFQSEPLADKLLSFGFEKNKKTLFVLEGLLMYLNPEAVDSTFAIMKEFAGKESEIVFDYVYSSVLRRENIYYGENDIYEFVTKAGECWTFGIEKGRSGQFVKKYGFSLVENVTSVDLENRYFQDENHRIVGKINGTHCIAYARK